MTLPPAQATPAEPFRVIALISAFNEEDVISPIIRHLVEGGVEVYLLDNRSTDETVEEARRWLGRGLLAIEPFPPVVVSGEPATFDWTAILRRKEELAKELEADWFLHQDADEIREAPWPGLSLKEGIRWVDALGYNCIDFRVLNFPPTDDGFRRGMDPARYFTLYKEAEEYDRVQLKCWKGGSGPISLAATGAAGGHDVRFRGRRVFPIPFLLRHYPIRGQSHGRRKVFEERKLRFAAPERARGWHVQYDAIPDERPSFLHDPRELTLYDADQVRLDLMLRNRLARETEQALTESEARLRAAESAAAQLAERRARRWTWRRSLRRFVGGVRRAREAGPPAVSVFLMTYNHERYVAQAVESVLTQRTDFDVELVILEDCSTDRTREIVSDLQHRHPRRIRLVLSERNVCNNRALAQEFQSSRSRYAAWLDGDDYWTAEDKLQRQADFLDAHPECALCFHNVTILHEDGSREAWARPGDLPEFSALEDLLRGNYIPGCSPMFRLGLMSALPEWYHVAVYGDWPLYILHARHGTLGYLDADMGVYRVHRAGLWSGLTPRQQRQQLIAFFEDLNANLDYEYDPLIRAKIADWRGSLEVEA